MNNKTTYEKLREKQEISSKEIKSIQDEYLQEELWGERNKPLEEKLYKEFVRCNKGKDFIDIEHIDNLGIKYDILIVVSIKNTGKNVGIIYKLFEKYYKMGKKVVFMRTSQKEITEATGEYNNTPSNPFKFETRKKILTAIHKETGEDVGIFKDFKFCNSGSGGEFADYGAIIYDECLSWDPRKTINRENYLNWAAFISSVSRNKKEGIKVYCLGNLTGLNTGLLEFYGINTDDDLRYIERFDPIDPNNVCKILYINANNIYKGIKTQVGSVQGMGPEYKTQLYSNKCDLNNLSILLPKCWAEMIPELAFIIISDNGKEKVLIEIRKTEVDRFKSEPVIYGVSARTWQPFYPVNPPIYTDNRIIHSTTDKTTYVKSINEFIYFINELIIFDKLFYCNKMTQDLIIALIKKTESQWKNKFF